MADLYLAGVFKGMSQETVLEILLLCEEICLASDFPPVGHWDEVELDSKYMSKVT